MGPDLTAQGPPIKLDVTLPGMRARWARPGRRAGWFLRPAWHRARSPLCDPDDRLTGLPRASLCCVGGPATDPGQQGEGRPSHVGAQTHCDGPLPTPSSARPPPLAYAPLPGTSCHTNAMWDLSCGHRSPQQPRRLDITPHGGSRPSLGPPETTGHGRPPQPRPGLATG